MDGPRLTPSRAFTVLVRARLLGACSPFVHGATRQRALIVGLGAVGALTMLALDVAFRAAYGLCIDTVSRTALARETWFLLFLLLCAGALPYVSGALLQSRDIALLAAMPLPPAAVVSVRLLEAAGTNALQLCVIGFPALAASAQALGSGAAGWVALVVLMPLFVLMPALATSLLLMAVTAVVGAGRVRRAVSLTSAVLAIVVCVVAATQVAGTAMPAGDASVTLNLRIRASWWAERGPTALFAETLGAASHGNVGEAGRGFLQLALATSALFAVCVIVGTRVLTAETLDDVQAPPARRARPRSTLRVTPACPMAALAGKDYRYLFRDTVLLAQVMVPMALFLVPFALEFRGILHGAASSHDVYLASLMMTGLAVFTQTSILSLSSVGMEGPAFWVMMQTPMGCVTFLCSKVMWAWSASAGSAVAQIALAGLFLHVPMASVLVHCGVAIVVTLVLCCSGVGLAATFPRFVYDNPAHRVSVWAMVLGLAAFVAYLTAIVVIWAVGAAYADVIPYAQWVATAGAAFVSCVVGIIPLATGAARLRSLEWRL